MNILILCTGNSARSILLESLLNTLGAGRVRAWSAGSKPTGKVHPQSVALLTQLGHDPSGARSKSWDEFALPDAQKMDAVITVCGSAAGGICPVWPGAPLRAHWGIEDPAATAADNWVTAFEAAYAQLGRKAEAFLAAPIETMDKPALQDHLNRVAKL